MFVLSKLASLALQPSFLAAMAVVVGLVLISFETWRRAGLRFAWGGLAYIVVGGIVPFGNLLILPLEQHFAQSARPTVNDGLAGIIILGGFEDGWVSAGRGQLTINEAGERLTEGVRLARELPATKVLFSGGVGALWRAGEDATMPVAAYLRAAGIENDRILVEGASRNTIENAQFSAELLKPNEGQRWVLVTSAAHMPRALGLYRKAGFAIQPWPVDYRTRGWQDVWRLFDRLPAGLQRTDLAVTEWIGLLVARFTGRIDQLFPAP
ncbi:MAG: YdcF family protein [Hyphomicrobium sp.]